MWVNTSILRIGPQSQCPMPNAQCASPDLVHWALSIVPFARIGPRIRRGLRILPCAAGFERKPSDKLTVTDSTQSHGGHGGHRVGGPPAVPARHCGWLDISAPSLLARGTTVTDGTGG